MSPAELIISALIIAVAVVAQASTGSGFGIVASPLLLMLSPHLVPGPLLLVSCVVMAFVTWQNRKGLRHLDLKSALGGCLPGALAGLWVLPLLNGKWTGVIVGGLVVASVLAGLARFQIPQNRISLIAAGVVGGVLGTVASTSGPPIVVVYRASDPDRYRANLSLFFLVSSQVSLLVLIAFGAFGTADLLASCWLLPGVVLGALASGPVVRRLSAAAIRPAALGLCLIAGVSLVVKGALA
ncbi:sulfite exporter TauE/SafE family protein [Arthrobacter sp. ISL-72]|uniref:sulfite exporter TauE/SafE family protein n=1 Tax=Arthrobacter sp. ISL-72 TaxID=2819114 RepID=UPI001BEA10B8|nr:sulfite exporter TauE/SafE family protein [Arthrobacter sp. ISL-72]MBT2594688.1 sulfite exporter TauE/SafE family protein [Arthrobacter sp. ISL-72]